MARRYDSIRILIPGLTLSAALLAGLASAGCQRPDPGSDDELRLIAQHCSNSSRNDTHRKIVACEDGARFGREARGSSVKGICDAAMGSCADQYRVDLATDPGAEADVFASCWTNARGYLKLQRRIDCHE